MADMALRGAKNALRKEIKQRLKALSETEKLRQSTVVSNMVGSDQSVQCDTSQILLLTPVICSV